MGRAVLAVLLARAVGGIDLNDVPLFTARCRVTGLAQPSGGSGAATEHSHPTVDPTTPHGHAGHAADDQQTQQATYYIGGVFAPATATAHGPADGGWSAALAFNATHASAVAQTYPNHILAPDADLPSHAARPFYEGYAGFSAHLGVGLTATATAGTVVGVECVVNFTASAAHPQDRQHSNTIRGRLQDNRFTASPLADANPYRQGAWPGAKTFAAFLGLMLSRDAKTGAPTAVTWGAWNQQQFWDRAASAVKANGGPALAPKRFPIGDTVVSDDDLDSALAIQATFGQLGLSVVTNAYDGQNSALAAGKAVGRASTEFLTLGAPSLFRKDIGSALGYADCSSAGSACTLHDYCTVNATDADLINDTDIDSFLHGQVAGFTQGGGAPHFVLTGEQDEPGWFWPVAVPPVATSPRVRARWQRYLMDRGLTPAGKHDRWQTPVLGGRCIFTPLVSRRSRRNGLGRGRAAWPHRSRRRAGWRAVAARAPSAVLLVDALLGVGRDELHGQQHAAAEAGAKRHARPDLHQLQRESDAFSIMHENCPLANESATVGSELRRPRVLRRERPCVRRSGLCRVRLRLVSVGEAGWRFASVDGGLVLRRGGAPLVVLRLAHALRHCIARRSDGVRRIYRPAKWR
jgi:hypothetical protein